MLHLESSLHAKLRAFLDGERLGFQSFNRARGGKVNDKIRSAFYLERERLNDAAPCVGWVSGKGSTSSDAERRLPSVQGFVVLV